MRTSILTLATVALIAGAAQADTVSGTIKSVGSLDRSVILTDGSRFLVPAATDESELDLLNGFRVGNEVTINFSSFGNTPTATSIKATSGTQTTGVIASIDDFRNTVYLADGSSFTFPEADDDDARNVLDGFRAGDNVSVSYIQGPNGVTPIALKSVRANDVSGKIVSIDSLGNKVTLDNGRSFTLPEADDDERNALDGFRVGDNIRVLTTNPNATTALAVSAL